MNRPRHLHRLLFICLAVTLLGRAALGAEIGLPDKLAFLALLEQGGFETLDRQLNAYQEAFEAGVIPDTLVDYAFSTFENSDPALEPRLANWIHLIPDSYAARATRGRYYTNLAWVARGDAFSRKTHKQIFVEMNRYFELAKLDLQEGIKIREKLSIATAMLIKTAMAQSDKKAVERLAEEGLAAAPRSAMIRRRHMANQLPWWGGTLEQMGRFLEATKQAYPNDELLREIYGYHDFNTALQLKRRGQAEDALTLLDRAIEQSDYWLYREERADMLFGLERYQESLEEFNTVLADWPQQSGALDGRAQVHFELGDVQSAFADWDAALALNPYEPDTLLQRAYALRDLERYDEALAFLNQAMVRGADDPFIRDARGRIFLYELDRPAEALADLKHTTELQPNSKRNWCNYGRALVGTYDCESTYALARYWDLCDGGAQCTQRDVKWAKAIVFGSLHHTSCWPAFARAWAARPHLSAQGAPIGPLC
jgi:tetratricopeptide (TPR) repeat protein